MSDAALEVEELHAGYGDVAVLRGVSLSVAAGAITCIIGSNGAGKTTLLRAVSGLVSARAGRVRAAGQDLTNAGPEAMVRAGVVHVPEGRRLFAAMSVRDNLLMGAYLRRDQAAIRRDLERVYETFPRLAERRHQDASTLSGGEQQMCAIGRGIMADPRVLMIDELSLGLAPAAVDLLMDALRAINAAGVAILLVEQDVMAALDVAHAGYILDRGSVVGAGSSAALAADPMIREAYLGAVQA
ncbi:branched-chain amino acid ABC transporter ATP-binding protein [Falsiroseomonas bella]|uniref:Branched-chain amino acid ABC transporter ATP-binding protein n=1 Tax=Falsiroseomonas bella TaxID=2184016 RepID=A0A317F9Q2_9PROT|nr:ABC transporter ATP-binding protein [Falsiroseomonas bella]PWS35222.1 branched-chain amino acid ABC transporter ATP-binding protein [Falsiroseomonas bella]